MESLFIGTGVFAVGVLLGLVFGPAKERIEAAHCTGFVEGYREGYREARRNPLPPPPGEPQ